jgi:PhnB protein
MARAKQAVPEGYQTVTPILTLDDAKKAIAWYVKALGAEELSRSDGPDGKVMHAEIRVGTSKIMLHDAMMGNKSPKDLGGSPAGLWLFVDDCDAVFNRAVAAGAQVTMPIADQFWGDRCGNIKDPFGFGWAIATRKEDLTREEMDRRAADFFKQMASQPQK